MDECLSELVITDTATDKRSSWHYIYKTTSTMHGKRCSAVTVARHRREGQITIIAKYYDEEMADIIVDMLSAGGHWYQTGIVFLKHPLFRN